MPPVKFSRVISVTSEDPKYPAKNLLKTEVWGSWKCKNPGEQLAAIILQLDRSCVIQSIDIGNENSAFVEIFVGKLVSPDEFEVLRVTSALMTVQEAKSGKNKNTVRFFKKEELSKPAVDQSWDRIKIVCTQPFNKYEQYGLSFVKVYAKSDDNEKNDDSMLGKFILKKEASENDPISVGSFFAKRKDIEQMSIASNNLGMSVLGKVSAAKRLSDSLPIRDIKKVRKNGDVSDEKCNDFRRAVTGPLFYTDEELVENAETNNKASKKEKSASPKNEKVKRKINSPNPIEKRTPHPSSSSKKIEQDLKIKRKPFNTLLENVVLVISGYQNPFRGQLRSKALKMGAKYKADWDGSCTHLICAFTNTPKYNQVLGQGWIVRKEWIEDCYNQKKRLLCLKYKLDKNDSYSNPNDEEIWEEENENRKSSEREQIQLPQSQPSSSGNPRLSSPEYPSETDIYNADTDVDSEHEDPMIETKYENVSLKILPKVFENTKFYLGTDLPDSTVQMLRRYIIAYRGESHDDVDNVTYIISGSSRYKENVNKIPVLLPDWVWECSDQKKLISVDGYLL